MLVLDRMLVYGTRHWHSTSIARARAIWAYPLPFGAALVYELSAHWCMANGAAMLVLALLQPQVGLLSLLESLLQREVARLPVCEVARLQGCKVARLQGWVGAGWS